MAGIGSSAAGIGSSAANRRRQVEFVPRRAVVDLLWATCGRVTGPSDLAAVERPGTTVVPPQSEMVTQRPSLLFLYERARCAYSAEGAAHPCPRARNRPWTPERCWASWRGPWRKEVRLARGLQLVVDARVECVRVARNLDILESFPEGGYCGVGVMSRLRCSGIRKSGDDEGRCCLKNMRSKRSVVEEGDSRSRPQEL